MTCGGSATRRSRPATWWISYGRAIPTRYGSSRLPGRALGDVLSTAVSLLNPDVLVIGGDIAHAHEHFLLGVRDTVLRAQPAAGHGDTGNRPTVLGDRAGIIGAAAMVADTIFGSAAVDAVVAEPTPMLTRIPIRRSDQWQGSRTNTQMGTEFDEGQSLHRFAHVAPYWRAGGRALRGP